MEPCKAIHKKTFVSEEANNCEEKFNLAQDRIGNIDWCICRCECKLMATFAESFCLLLGINHRSVRGASCPSALWQLPDYQPHELALVHDGSEMRIRDQSKTLSSGFASGVNEQN